MAKLGSKEWLDNFISSLQAQNTTTNTVLKSPAAKKLQQTYADLIMANQPEVKPVDPYAGSTYITPEMAANMANPRDFSPPVNPVEWTVDKLLRPLRAVAQTVGSVAGDIAGEKVGDISSNPAEAFWQGLSGQNPSEFIDVLKQAGAPGYVSGPVGFTADILLDPANAVIGPVGAAAIRGARGLSKAGQLEKAAQAARDLQRGRDLVDTDTDFITAAQNAEINARKNFNYEQTHRAASAAARSMSDETQASKIADLLTQANATRATQNAEDAIQQRIRGIRTPEMPNTELNMGIPGPRTVAPAGLTGRVGDNVSDALMADLYKRASAKDAVADSVIEDSKLVKPTTPAKAAENLNTEARIQAVNDKLDDLSNQVDKSIVEAAVSGNDVAEQSKVLDEILAKDKPKVDVQERQGFIQNLNTDSRSFLYRELGLKGEPQNMAQREMVLPQIEQKEAYDLAQGRVHKIASGPGQHEWNITHSQVIKALPEDTQINDVFGFPNVPPSALDAMAAKRLDLMGMEHMDLTSDQAASQIAEAGWKAIDPSYYAKDIGKMKAKDLKDQLEIKVHNVAYGLVENGDALRDAVRANLKAHYDQLNTAGSFAGHIVNQSIDDNFARGVLSDSIKDVTDTHKIVNDAVSGNKDAQIIADAVVGEHVADTTTTFDRATSKEVQKNIRDLETESPAKAKEDIRNRGVQRGKLVREEVDEKIWQELHLSRDAYPDADYIDIEKGMERARNPIIGVLSRFGRSAGDFGIDYTGKRSWYLTHMRDYTVELNRIKKAYSPEDIRSAWTAIRTKTTDTADDTIQDIIGAMEDAGEHLFEIKGDGPLYSVFFREGYFRKDVEKALKEQGFKGDYYRKIPKNVEAAGPKAINEYLADSWRHIDPKDPLEFLEQMNGAAMKLAAMKSIADQMTKWAVTKIPEGAAADGIKYVKLPEHWKQETDILQYVARESPNGKPLLYPEPLVDQMVNLEREILTPANPQGKLMGPFAREVVDPLMASWKPLVTVIRPGHNMRNSISDIMLNYMAGLKSIVPYKKATVALKAGGHFPSPLQGSLDKLLATGTEKGVKKYDTVTVHLRGGRTEEIKAPQLYEILYEDGMLPGYHQTEDILEEGKTGLGKLAAKVQNNRLVRFGGKWSEYSTHLTRASQYIHEIESKTFKDMDQARLFAADRTRKFHPDTSTLSPEARRYARRIIPFYSWFRQMLPVVFEVAVTKPTRITFFNKAVYGIQNTFNGTQPGENITNPFPVTRLIPNFIRDTLGYAGGSMVFNAGTPVEAMADVFNGNVGRNILGMANPLAKIPFEAITGQNIGTGTNIVNASDYIDRQIPLVSNFASIMGYSPTGTIANWATGGSTPNPNTGGTWSAGLDPTRAKQLGEKTTFWNTSLANFLFGMGIQSFDRPSYESIAEREQKFQRSR